jgi:aminoglycoside 3-N-acetyltransferase
VPVIEHGRRVWRWMEEFDTAEPCHARWPQDAFRQITDAFLAQEGNAGGRIGDAASVLLDAQPLMTFAVAFLASLVTSAITTGALPGHTKRHRVRQTP